MSSNTSKTSIQVLVYVIVCHCMSSTSKIPVCLVILRLAYRYWCIQVLVYIVCLVRLPVRLLVRHTGIVIPVYIIVCLVIPVSY